MTNILINCCQCCVAQVRTDADVLLKYFIHLGKLFAANRIDKKSGENVLLGR